MSFDGWRGLAACTPRTLRFSVGLICFVAGISLPPRSIKSFLFYGVPFFSSAIGVREILARLAAIFGVFKRQLFLSRAFLL